MTETFVASQRALPAFRRICNHQQHSFHMHQYQTSARHSRKDSAALDSSDNFMILNIGY